MKNRSETPAIQAVDLRLRRQWRAYWTAALVAALLAPWAPVLGATTGNAGKGGEKPAEADKRSVEEKRQAVLKMRDETLKRLYAKKPEVKEELEKAEGYAVFAARSVYAVLFVGIRGSGVLVDNKSGKVTYMNMTRAGTGPGVGARKYRLIFAFKSRSLLDKFASVGADVSAEAKATIKFTDEGGQEVGASGSFNPYLSVYELTDRGLAMQASWGGTAYLPDAELNAASGPK